MPDPRAAPIPRDRSQVSSATGIALFQCAFAPDGTLDAARFELMNPSDDLPLTLADLDRLRADLQESARHTEIMLARTEGLLLGMALLRRGQVRRILNDQDISAGPPPSVIRPDTSTN